MNGRTNYLMVGIFVTAGIILLIAVSLMFAGGHSSEPRKRYTLLFERDISGLAQGAPVRYLGVDVGEVIGMQLVSNGYTRVQVDVEVLESTPITRHSYASLSFQGVTGVAFISLAADPADPADGNSADSNNPADGDLAKNVSRQKNAQPQAVALPQAAGFEYPVIPTRDVGLSALLSEGPDISRKLTLLLERANVLLDDKNIAAISRSLANIESLSGSLPAQLHSTLAQVERGLGQLETTLAHAEPEVLATLKNLRTSSARLDNWMLEHADELEQFMDAGLTQTPALISETRQTLRELEKLLADLRDNPSQMVTRPQRDPVVVKP